MTELVRIHGRMLEYFAQATAIGFTKEYAEQVLEEELAISRTIASRTDVFDLALDRLNRNDVEWER